MGADSPGAKLSKAQQTLVIIGHLEEFDPPYLHHLTGEDLCTLVFAGLFCATFYVTAAVSAAVSASSLTGLVR